jgi:hypothetical protein
MLRSAGKKEEVRPWVSKRTAEGDAQSNPQCSAQWGGQCVPWRWGEVKAKWRRTAIWRRTA